jgi:mitosis inhibitor protein kinase SWE1
LRQEDFSQVDLDESPELLYLIKQLMRTDPTLRINAQDTFDHPIVSRARAMMERTYNQAMKNGTSVFAASPLASVPDSFLIEILGRSPGLAMDTSP